MKKLLFISPDYYGFHEVLLDGFQKYSNHDVTLVITNEKYGYKNFLEKINNFLSKTFLKKNLKKIKQEELINNNILKNDKYDIVFVNRPDMLSERTYQILNTICKIKITYYWDSFDKIKGQEETIKYFDKCFSFEKRDCLKYNLKENNNFYFENNNNNNNNDNEIDCDICFLGTFDLRFSILLDILSKLKTQFLTANCVIYSNKNIDKLQKNNPDVFFISNPIGFNESTKVSKKARIILDVQHENQEGLSFRPFEAMGLRKKLITTNKNIIKYDFYNPNNIFVWEEDSVELPQSFLTTDYEDLDKKIMEKYYIKNWVERIIN